MAKIMVVDDSEIQRKQIRAGLEKAGHEVIEAQDGQVGLEAMQANPGVALIICDVNMPNMDGMAMISKIHESGKLAGVPVFMLTTETSLELKQKAKSFGVKAWVNKPFVTEKLLDAVEKVLKKA